MKYASLNDHTFALRLDHGDDIHDSIQTLCAELNVNNASIQGIGSVESPTLAHYSMVTKKFTDLQLDGILEVTALLGNVALLDGKPFAHLHATVADSKMTAHAGHLVKGTCSATLEIIVTTYPSHHWKSPDEASGLNIWDFQH